MGFFCFLRVFFGGRWCLNVFLMFFVRVLFIVLIFVWGVMLYGSVEVSLVLSANTSIFGPGNLGYIFATVGPSFLDSSGVGSGLNTLAFGSLRVL